MLIVDETADEKSSADAVGAARQYSGTVGGVALCQVAVTLTYATRCAEAAVHGASRRRLPAADQRGRTGDVAVAGHGFQRVSLAEHVPVEEG